MKPTTGTIRTSLGAAALGCAVTLLATWPSQGNAADDAPAAEAPPLPPDAAQIGDLTVTSEVKAAANGRWVFALHARNDSSDRTARARLQAVVEEQVFQAESRSGPMPEIAWHAEESLAVPPGETVTRTWDVPRQLAFRLQKSVADQKRMEAGQGVALSRTYTATVREVEADAEQARGGGVPSAAIAPRLSALELDPMAPSAPVPAASTQPIPPLPSAAAASAAPMPQPLPKAPASSVKKQRLASRYGI